MSGRLPRAGPLKSGVHPWPDRYGGLRWWTCPLGVNTGFDRSRAGFRKLVGSADRFRVERIEIRSDERQELVSTATAMSSSEQHGMSPPSATALDCDRCNFRRSSVKRERLSVRGPASVSDRLPRAAIRETLPNGGLYVLNSAK